MYNNKFQQIIFAIAIVGVCGELFATQSMTDTGFATARRLGAYAQQPSENKVLYKQMQKMFNAFYRSRKEMHPSDYEAFVNDFSREIPTKSAPTLDNIYNFFSAFMQLPDINQKVKELKMETKEFWEENTKCKFDDYVIQQTPPKTVTKYVSILDSLIQGHTAPEERQKYVQIKYMYQTFLKAEKDISKSWGDDAFNDIKAMLEEAIEEIGINEKIAQTNFFTYFYELVPEETKELRDLKKVSKDIYLNDNLTKHINNYNS